MIQFSKAQRADLIRYGLSKAQISALERNSLPLAKAWLTKAPPMVDVRGALKTLHYHFHEARKILTRSKDQAAVEALSRLYLASDEDIDLVQTAPAILRTLTAITDEALQQLPNTARRHRTADPLPVALIWKTLVNSFAAEHYRVRRESDVLPATTHAPPPFRLKLSSAATSPFRKIVEICYGAMTGNYDASPERAIKAFIKQKKEAAKR